MPDPTTASGPKLVFIIRHGEKPGDPAVDNDADGPNLSTRGHEQRHSRLIFPPHFLSRISSWPLSSQSTATGLSKPLRPWLKHSDWRSTQNTAMTTTQ